MKAIDIENHFITKELLAEKGCSFCGTKLPEPEASKYMEMQEKVAGNIGEGRIADMDKAGVTFAQVSLTTPGSEAFEPEKGKMIAETSNDALAAMIKEYPKRLGGWIAIYPKDPEWSVKEINRAAKMGLWGVNVFSNFGDSYMDEPRYWPILGEMEKRGMPLYIHPNESTIKDFNEFGYCIGGPNFGFTVDTLYCILRMIMRGVFDEFPKLKVITGHFGEALPFLKNRIDTAYRQGYGWPNEGCGSHEHEPSYYVDRNIYASTSGNFLPAALHCSVESFGKEKVMLSTDYPFEDFKGSVDFIVNDPVLTDDEKEHILYKNAQSFGFGKNI